MTQRERVLSIIVASLLAFGFVYWIYGKYDAAVKLRQNKIASLEETQRQHVEQQMQGALADRQMGEYVVRSLSGDTERARSDYSRWLREMTDENRLRGTNIGKPSKTSKLGVYNQHSYRVTGTGDFGTVIDLLHAFYAKDYLHRIQTLDVKPKREGGFDITMMIDALSLNEAPVDAVEPASESWRVDGDLASYREPILNRNLFEPPNQAPKYTGKSSVQAFVGKSTPITLTFKDPENQRLMYSLIDAPADLVSLDERTGTLKVMSSEKQEIQVELRATDAGYPKRSVDHKLTINVVDEPPPPEPPPEKPKFDDASQTVLTGLVQGSKDWTAWMNVRTKGKTIKLRVGDQFEIGQLKGKVTEITAKFVEIEIDEGRFTLNLNKSLGEAARRAKED